MKKKLKILVKLPDKLGDTIMANSFLKELRKYFPGSKIDVIMINSFSELKVFMPHIDHVYEFPKKEYSGVGGKYRYGRFIAKQDSYDLYFGLPFSFSTALIGFFTNSKRRIGYRTEHRGFLLTDSFTLPPDLHVVEDYVTLLALYLGRDIEIEPPSLKWPEQISFGLPSEDYMVLNVPSGPPSRFIPVAKSVDIIRAVKAKFPFDIVLTGAPQEKNYVDEIEDLVTPDFPVINLAGKTSIVELGWVLKNARIMVTTDTGNMHFANALDTKTVVLFGPGIQSRCRPYNSDLIKSLQLLDMECVPCNKEKCKYGDNRCLANLDTVSIIAAMAELLNRG